MRPNELVDKNHLFTLKNYAVQDLHKELGKKQYSAKTIFNLAKKAALLEMACAKELIEDDGFNDAFVNLQSVESLCSEAMRWQAISDYDVTKFTNLITELLTLNAFSEREKAIALKRVVKAGEYKRAYKMVLSWSTFDRAVFAGAPLQWLDWVANYRKEDSGKD